MTKDVIVYGKDKCKLCDAAKDKLKRMGIPFEFRQMQDVVDAKIQDVAALSEYSMQGGQLPIIVIYDRGYSYPAAMKFFKGNDPEEEGS